MECYKCEAPLTKENKSIEHIIPNGIGGKLKSKSLLCKKCNRAFGDTYDAEFCKKLNTMGALLMIKRERNSNPKIKNVKSDSGELYNLVDGIHPEPIKPDIDVNEEENTIHIGARDEKELRHIIQQLKKKYPTLDDQSLEKKMIRSKYYLNEALHLNLSVGGNGFMKAVLKIAINFYIFKTKRKDDVVDAIAKLESLDELSNDLIHHYYTEDSTNYSDGGEVSHTIHIFGNSEKKLLYAFVEIFSSFAFIVNLNTNYIGDNISYTYCYDVLTKKEIKKEINLSYEGSLKGDLALLNQEFIARIQKKVSRVMAIADKRQINLVISNITRTASKEYFKSIPMGTIITEEMVNGYFNRVAKDAAPFIYHLQNRRAKKDSENSKDV